MAEEMHWSPKGQQVLDDLQAKYDESDAKMAELGQQLEDLLDPDQERQFYDGLSADEQAVYDKLHDPEHGSPEAQKAIMDGMSQEELALVDRVMMGRVASEEELLAMGGPDFYRKVIEQTISLKESVQ